jgi:recombination protein RecA
MGLEDLKKKLQDSVKGVHIDALSANDMGEKKWYPTPAYDLNRIISGSLFKALPSRSYTMLVAPEATFKSSMMALCGAEAQRQGMLPVIFDTEGAWEPDFVERWGMNPDNVLRIYTPWIDKIMTMMGQIIDDPDASNMFLMLDSIGGLEKFKMIEDATGKDGHVKADQGTLQKTIKRMLKMYLNIIKGKDSIGMSSGHFYGNPNSYGGADEIGGGKFAKLAPDIIISMKKQNIVSNPSAKVADQIITGTEIKACTLKNRYAPPFQEATVQIDYKNGINRYAGLLDIALTCGLMEKAGSWFKFQGESIAQGAVKATEWIAENPDKFLDPFEDILKTSGYSTINQDVEEAMRLAEVAQAEETTTPAKKGRGKKNE